MTASVGEKLTSYSDGHIHGLRLAIDSLYQFAAIVKGATLGFHYSTEQGDSLLLGPPLAVGAYIDGRIHIPVSVDALPEELPDNLVSTFGE